METTSNHTVIQSHHHEVSGGAMPRQTGVLSADLNGFAPVQSNFPAAGSQGSNITLTGIVINLVLVISLSILASGILNLLLLIP